MALIASAISAMRRTSPSSSAIFYSLNNIDTHRQFIVRDLPYTESQYHFTTLS
jgi:oligoribonuclease (3'-5' exoribonuclease)